MTQIATVERILNDKQAEISVPRKSACGHDCEECAGCGVSGAAVHAVAFNLIQARPGQKVIVETSTRHLLGMAFLVYLLPVVFFLIGYVISVLGDLREGLCYAIAIGAFCVGIIPAVWYDRRLKRQGGISYAIVRLF